MRFSLVFQRYPGIWSSDKGLERTCLYWSSNLETPTVSLHRWDSAIGTWRTARDMSMRVIQSPSWKKSRTFKSEINRNLPTLTCLLGPSKSRIGLRPKLPSVWGTFLRWSWGLDMVGAPRLSVLLEVLSSETSEGKEPWKTWNVSSWQWGLVLRLGGFGHRR